MREVRENSQFSRNHTHATSVLRVLMFKSSLGDLEDIHSILKPSSLNPFLGFHEDNLELRHGNSMERRGGVGVTTRILFSLNLLKTLVDY